jgi:hypothetical protein
MMEGPTLNSRLRLLIAKSYRAEKLYSSLRSADAGKLATAGALSDVANDLRSREWQRSYNELRVALNEAVKLSSSSAVAAELFALRGRFLTRVEEDRQTLDASTGVITEAAAREEYAHIVKLSLELIRRKARLQACKAIADELTALLQASSLLDSAQTRLAAGILAGGQVESSAAADEALRTSEAFSRQDEAQLPQPRGNVIMLRRKTG